MKNSAITVRPPSAHTGAGHRRVLHRVTVEGPWLRPCAAAA